MPNPPKRKAALAAPAALLVFASGAALLIPHHRQRAGPAAATAPLSATNTRAPVDREAIRADPPTLSYAFADLQRTDAARPQPPGVASLPDPAGQESAPASLQNFGHKNPPTAHGASDRHRAMASNLRRMRALRGDTAGDGTVAADAQQPVPWICFAPDTPVQLVELLTGSAHGHRDLSPAPPTAAAAAASSARFGAAAFQYLSTARWSSTATNSGGLGQGDATVLTWSIVADGRSIPGNSGEPTSPSDLRARLDEIYPGGEAQWLPLFESVFARWSELTGVKYVYQPNDSGSFPNRSGSSRRGDIRIAGHPIDGDSGVLAYNFGPNTGDMVIDTDDSYFNSTSNNSRRLRNTISHEHGHGLGLAHVCPLNSTKLMEPFASSAFDGPQLDDIYTAQRQYGDRLEDPDSDATSEDNDSLARAAGLGTLAPGVHLVEHLSIDDNSDEDYLSFTPAVPGSVMQVELRPVGSTYREGPQNADDSCSAGVDFNSLAVHDLSLQVLDSGGSTLAGANATGAGSPESIEAFALPDGATVLLIDGDSTDRCQLYELQITLIDPATFPTLTVADANAEETAPSMQFLLTLDEPLAIEATVDFSVSSGTASAGDDFVSSSGTVSFPPGITEGVIDVSLIDDSLAEADETLVLTLSSPHFLQLSNTTATGTIPDDDAPAELAKSGTLSRTAEDRAEIGWAAVPGRTYTVEYSDDMQLWHPLPGYESITIGTGGETAIDPSPLSARRFYRVIEPE